MIIKRSRNWLWGILATSICLAILSIFIPIRRKDRNDWGDSNRGKCISNLHQIGLGIQMYCTDFGGDFPDTFQTLLLQENISPSVFICPASQDNASTAPTTRAQADDLTAPGHLSYIYLGRGLTEKTVEASQVIAYESASHHFGEIDVLLGNGDVKGLELERSNKVLAAVLATTRPVMLPP